MSRQAFKDGFQKKYREEVTAGSDVDPVIPITPTGIYAFDMCSGIGGFPRGRIVEVFGPESGGKSLLCLAALAYAQKMEGALGLYFDVEGATPTSWLQTLGIDLEKIDIVNASLSAEQNFDAIVEAVNADCYTYIIIDSLAGLLPKQELEGSIEKDYVGTVSRVTSKGLRKIINALSKVEKGPTIIFINQLRDKVGVMFGNPETTPGGKSLKFYASQRYRVSKRSGSDVKDGTGVIGHSIKVKNAKNKLAPPQREGEFSVNYMEGVNTVDTLMSTLKEQKLYTKTKQNQYILKLSDNDPEMAFAKVDEIRTKLTEDKEFQKHVYKTLLSKFVEIKVAGEATADDDFESFGKEEEEGI